MKPRKQKREKLKNKEDKQQKAAYPQFFIK